MTQFTKLTMDQFLKNWPLEAKPRDIQLAAAEKTIESFNQGVKYVALELPVGAGKSATAMSFARMMGDSHFQTLTEQLQLQYLRDFQKFGMEALKGRAKFTCNRAGEGYSCADGKVMFEGKNKCRPEACSYILARERALNAQHTVSNYHSFLYNIGLAAPKRSKRARRVEGAEEEFPARDYMRALTVIDECHAMEPFLLEQASVEVNLRRLSFPVPPLPLEQSEDTIETRRYIQYVREELVPRLDKYVETSTARGILDPRTKDELGSLRSRIQRVLDAPDEEWVAERERAKDGKGFTPDRFALKPLTAANYGRWLTGFGERLLLMSGTILSPFQMVSSVGLDPNQGDFHTFDSPFPPENRPIYADNLNMSFDARDESWPRASEMTNMLLEFHKNEKGLLLAPSNKLLQYLIERMPDPHKRRILKAVGEDRNKKYNEHLTSRQPTVLAASGFWEGADLKGDASRFQIIPQLPRPMLQGQVKARMTGTLGGREWYRWLTFVKTGQGLGRSIRTETDEAVTYIFDADFRNELARGDKSLLPKWVRSSVHVKKADDAGNAQWVKWEEP